MIDYCHHVQNKNGKNEDKFYIILTFHNRRRAFSRAVLKEQQATSLVFRAELKMAADNSQQTLFC